MSIPRPVPSGCIDTTPPVLWETLWRVDPKGECTMNPITTTNGKRAVFWKGYGIELSNTDLPPAFVAHYRQKFPDGHPEDRTPTQYEPRQDESKQGYFMVNGSLQYKTADGRVFHNATGADRFTT